MILSKSVAELQRERVVLELECIDRMYLNAYVPQLTSEAGVAGFVRGYLGHRFASTKAVAWDTPEHYAQLLKLIPYKRIGEPQEIGRAAAWLASDDSDYVHGITLFVDGGMTLYPGFETGG